MIDLETEVIKSVSNKAKQSPELGFQQYRTINNDYPELADTIQSRAGVVSKKIKEVTKNFPFIENQGEVAAYFGRQRLESAVGQFYTMIKTQLEKRDIPLPEYEADSIEYNFSDKAYMVLDEEATSRVLYQTAYANLGRIFRESPTTYDGITELAKDTVKGFKKDMQKLHFIKGFEDDFAGVLQDNLMVCLLGLYNGINELFPKVQNNEYNS